MRTTQQRLQPQQQESIPLPMSSFHISYALARASRNGNRFGTHQFFLQIPANAPRYRERLSRAASEITSITRSVAVYIGLWSTRLERTFAPIRFAMNFCVWGLIMRSSSASKNQDGFAFHPGAGATS